MLLLREYLKKTDSSHPDYKNIQTSLKQVMDVIEVVNDTIKFNEKETEFWNEPTLKPFMAPQRHPLKRGLVRMLWPPGPLGAPPSVATLTSVQSASLSSNSSYSSLPGMMERSASSSSSAGSKLVRTVTERDLTLQLFLLNDILIITDKNCEKLMDSFPIELLWLIEAASTSHTFVLATPERQFTVFPEPSSSTPEWISQMKLALEHANKGKSDRRVVSYTFKDGSTYQGEWVGGPFPSGQGTYRKVNAAKISFTYKGELKWKRMDGEGHLKYATGEAYMVSFKDDQPHGRGTLMLVNGWSYNGEWNAGRRHGTGKLYSLTSSDFYEGEWQDNMMHGEGELRVGTTYYKGGWVRNKREGFGECSLNGWTYLGDWLKDKWQGKGLLKLGETGEYYEGEFFEGLYHGQGKLEGAEFVYEGGWNLGAKHGKGVIQYQAGLKYEGDWSNDLWEGRGICQYSDGSVYEGSFKAGKRDGEGKMTWHNNDVYAGSWVNDLPEGKGKKLYADKSNYEGEWKAGMRDGEGIMKSPNGAIYEGQSRANKRQGMGKQFDYQGVYEGYWHADMKEGEGTMEYSDKKRYVGQWKHDMVRIVYSAYCFFFS
jgi:hypothetical protein